MLAVCAIMDSLISIKLEVIEKEYAKARIDTIRALLIHVIVELGKKSSLTLALGNVSSWVDMLHCFLFDSTEAGFQDVTRDARQVVARQVQGMGNASMSRYFKHDLAVVEDHMEKEDVSSVFDTHATCH
jgi:hypothetical protein